MTYGSVSPRSVAVVGAAARDLVLLVPEVPEPGGSTDVVRARERLGGKGANIAAAIRQLQPSVAVSLIASLGTDQPGDNALADALRLGIDTTGVRRRGTTSLLVDIVDSGGHRRLFEQVPAEARVTRGDVESAASVLSAADIVVLQLQQDGGALLAAARIARSGSVPIVLDGAVEGEARDELLSMAAVVRADGHEAELLSGRRIENVDDARAAAADLLARGPRLVALTVPGTGDLVAWAGGSRLHRHQEADVVDRTGAGDAFVAGIVDGLLRDDTPDATGRRGADAAAAAVAQLGGFTRLAP